MAAEKESYAVGNSISFLPTWGGDPMVAILLHAHGRGNRMNATMCIEEYH